MSAMPTWESPIADDLAEGLEGGVVRHRLDRVLRRDNPQRIATFAHLKMLDAGVAQPYRDVRAALAGGDDPPSAQLLERYVPEPGRVGTVGYVGVDRHHQPGRLRCDHGQRLLPSCRVLRQQESNRSPGIPV